MIKDVFKAIGGLFFCPFWYLQKLIKRDRNTWIFGAWKGERYADNSRALYEYVLQHQKNIDAIWITRNRAVYQQLKEKGLPVEMANSFRGIKATLRSGVYVLSWWTRDVNHMFVNGAKIIQLWHGLPLKKIGNDEYSFTHQNSSLWKKFKTAVRKVILPYEFIDYDATISTSPIFSKCFSSAFALPLSRVWQEGYPRNDRFFDSETEPLINQINQTFGNPLKIAYLPTFRDYAYKENRPFNPFLLAGYDNTEMTSFLEKENAVLIYKGHFMEQTKEVSLSNRIISINDGLYDDLYRFLKDVDLLITDYSGMYFDFLLTRKPILLFPFDYQDYISSRPIYFDYSLLRANRVYSWHELIHAIQNKEFSAPSSDEISFFHSFSDGQSSARVYKKIQEFITQ